MCAPTPFLRVPRCWKTPVLLGLVLAVLYPPGPGFGQERTSWVENAYSTIFGDLNRFVEDQQAYFEAHREYSTNLESLECQTSPGVALGVAAGPWGFTAVGTHETLGAKYGCSVFLGEMDPPTSPVTPTEPGVVTCSENHPSSPQSDVHDWPDLANGPVPVFYDVAPMIKDPKQLARQMEREYPRELMTRWVGGTTMVSVFVCERGLVRALVMVESSGNETLDRAALRVAKGIEFHPASRDGEPVGVWVTVPVTFTAK
jgi:TonB family protein